MPRPRKGCGILHPAISFPMELKNHKISAIRPARGTIACYVRHVTKQTGKLPK
jgi:hypothetical protein